MRDVDLLGQFRKLLYAAPGVLVALLEGLERGSGLATEAERGGYFRPIELECCASLEGGTILAMDTRRRFAGVRHDPGEDCAEQPNATPGKARWPSGRGERIN